VSDKDLPECSEELVGFTDEELVTELKARIRACGGAMLLVRQMDELGTKDTVMMSVPIDFWGGSAIAVGLAELAKTRIAYRWVRANERSADGRE